MSRISVIIICIYSIITKISAQTELKFRIIGGEDAVIEEYPYAVSITYHDIFQCGGSVIHTRHVLSASHCFHGKTPKSIKRYFHVHAGLSDMSTEERIATSANTQRMLRAEELKMQRNMYTIDFVKMHPNYVHGKFINDICVIRVGQEFVYNDLIQPIALPYPDFALSPGEEVHVVGWGLTEFDGSRSERLQTVNVSIFEHKQCVETYGRSQLTITEDMLCAGDDSTRRDACSGDSGGPLVYFMPVDEREHGDDEVAIQVGIVSWGYKCGDLGYPGIYANVAVFIDWIREQVNTPYSST